MCGGLGAGEGLAKWPEEKLENRRGEGGTAG